MNMYDTKIVHCIKCDSYIGEVAYDAEIILPKCGKCVNPMPSVPDDPSHIFSLSTSEQKPILLVH